MDITDKKNLSYRVKRKAMKEHAASGERARKTKDLCAKRTIVGAPSRGPRAES